jgi:shikimate kinase
MERVLFVGFMGSGKTKVGQSLATRLAWPFIDFDEEIQRRTGLPISEIFHQHGEAFFRGIEENVGFDLLRRRQVVLASGGGWPAVEGRMERLGSGTLSVWLEVSPEVAVQRSRAEGATRPLLDVPEPLEKARELLEVRAPYYRKAHLTLDSSTVQPEELAERIFRYLNEKGWVYPKPLPPYK